MRDAVRLLQAGGRDTSAEVRFNHVWINNTVGDNAHCRAEYGSEPYLNSFQGGYQLCDSISVSAKLLHRQIFGEISEREQAPEAQQVEVRGGMRVEASSTGPKASGRYGSGSLSPGRMTANRRIAAAAAAQAVHTPPTADKKHAATPQAESHENIDSVKKNSLRELRTERSVRRLNGSEASSHSATRQPAQKSHPVGGPREEVSLDHLTKMLQTGQIQDSWGAVAGRQYVIKMFVKSCSGLHLSFNILFSLKILAFASNCGRLTQSQI